MSIPEACIEAAYPPDPAFGLIRARRVILALAENLPESAVRASFDAFCRSENTNYGSMRAAIIAGLNDVVEGE